MTTTMDYAAQTPMARRINLKLILLLTLAAFPFIWFLYAFLSQSISGGITHHAGYDLVDLKQLGNFMFDENAGTINDVPARWRALDGKRVALEGFMWAGTSASPRVRDFQFVYNITKCCFSGPPQVQERVFAHVDEDNGVPYVGYLVRVIGTLHVDPRRDPAAGKVLTVYTLDVDKIEPVQ